MRVKLSVRQSAHQCAEFLLDRFPVVIGRSEHADVTLDDRWASRRHCRIEAQDGMLVVQDLGSKYGTLLNDAVVSEGVLKPGDTLRIGLSTLVASYVAAGAEQLEEAPTSARR